MNVFLGTMCINGNKWCYCRGGNSSALRDLRVFSRRDATFSFAASATVPTCLDLAVGRPDRWPSPAEGPSNSLLEGSRGRRNRRSTWNRLNVGSFMPA